jgi:alkanesulfonate monooxygenase SsuD/methylene tetrahydromethanopterin reductase-like flavin-dependent oxidoreductase (luciferase family)
MRISSRRRSYLTDVRCWLHGEGPATHLPQRPASVPVPLYVGSLTSSTVELGAELADGIMPLFWSVERVAESREWAARGRAKASESGLLAITLGLPTYVGDDLDALRDVARQNLVLYTGLPLFRGLLRVSGFADEAALMKRRLSAVFCSTKRLWKRADLWQFTPAILGFCVPLWPNGVIGRGHHDNPTQVTERSRICENTR